MQKTVSILGCGWLGIQLGKNLISKGYRVYGSTTTPSRIFELAEAEIKPVYINIEPGTVNMGSEAFFDTPIVVVSLPPQGNANVETFFPGQIAEVIKLVKQFHVPRVLFISSTSVYESLNTEVREGEEGMPEKPAGRALLKAENLLFAEKTFSTTVVRFCGLIGPGRNPARYFAGKSNIPGKVPVNMIHSTDCVNILAEIIENNFWGEIFNACCPEHPLREEFYRKASVVSGLPAPKFINRTENHKIINSDKLQKRLNYKFKYKNPIDCLQGISV